jgi:hypothetical protein
MERARDERKEINRGDSGEEPVDNNRGEQPQEQNDNDEKKNLNSRENENIEEESEYDPSDDGSHESNPDNVNDQVDPPRNKE